MGRRESPTEIMYKSSEILHKSWLFFETRLQFLFIATTKLQTDTSEIL